MRLGPAMTLCSRLFPALRMAQRVACPALVLTAALVCMPGATRANESCPWLNEATAAGFLKATVIATVTHPAANKNDATCEFTHRDGSGVTSLKIEVETMSATSAPFRSYEARCGSRPEAIKAVGNEAIACTISGKNDKFSEIVIGRVRDRAFTIRIDSAGDLSTEATLRDRARRIAEQVAGFLF